MDEALAGLAEQGIEPEKPPYSVSEGGSLLCFVRDPDGYRIEIIERAEPGSGEQSSTVGAKPAGRREVQRLRRGSASRRPVDRRSAARSTTTTRGAGSATSASCSAPRRAVARRVTSNATSGGPGKNSLGMPIAAIRSRETKLASGARTVSGSDPGSRSRRRRRPSLADMARAARRSCDAPCMLPRLHLDSLPAMSSVLNGSWL